MQIANQAEHDRREFSKIVYDITADMNLRTKLKGFLKLMTTPTPEQIEEEVERLESILGRVRQLHDSEAAHDDLKCQIRVLRERMDYDEASDEYEDGRSMDAVAEALNWLHGDLWELHSIEPPSVRWASLLPEQVAA